MGLMLWNPIGNPQSCLEEYKLPIQLVMRVVSVLPVTAVNAVVALDLHSRFGLICGPCRTIRILWEDRISCIDEVSFKIKGTLLFQ